MTKELQLQLRFDAMILQSYKSLRACKTLKHFLNVSTGWIRRLETEFPLNERRTFSVETLKTVWRAELERHVTMVDVGEGILKKAFEQKKDNPDI